MNTGRIIARIDIKNGRAIKGIQLEGQRDVGCPNALALRYYQNLIDEIVFMDSVASLYGRNNLFETIKNACAKIFVPIAVGGGIRSMGDINQALLAGADKVIVNTAAIKNLAFISEAAREFGSQCIVGSIEAKNKGDNWECYYDNGREPSGKNAADWARSLTEAGAGEILVTSVDKEGTMRGMDVNLIQTVVASAARPVLASGGVGSVSHLKKVLGSVAPSGIVVASVLHYEKEQIAALKACFNPEGK